MLAAYEITYDKNLYETYRKIYVSEDADKVIRYTNEYEKSHGMKFRKDKSLFGGYWFNNEKTVMVKSEYF